MHFTPLQRLVSPAVFLSLVVLLLASCDMPDKPEGVDQEGMERIGDQLHQHGDDEGAADFYERALERKPKDAAARIKLAVILEAHSATANALTLYQQGLQVDPTNAEFMRAEGQLYIKLNRPQDAREAYEDALRIDPNDSKALNGLGISLDYLNQHEAAQKAYREALEHDPNNLSTTNNLAHSCVLAGGYDEAIKLLEPYAQDKNASPALRQNLAEAYGLNGMEADAERMLRMDLPPSQVERDMAYYRSERAKLNLTPRLHADLGIFATEAMAQAHMNEVKMTIGDDMAGLLIGITPKVKSIGSTPDFALQVTGFGSAGKLRSFCDRLKDSDIGCIPVSGS